MRVRRAQEGYVPGLGPASVKKLAEKGVTTTVQLMGEFLMKERSRADFCTLLTEGGGLRQRCAARGVRCACASLALCGETSVRGR
jgi:hypothetical protein